MRRKRLLVRLVPPGALIVLAFVAGLLLSSDPAAAERATVAQYVRDWTAGRYRDMYALLDAASRHKTTEVDFQAMYVAAANTSTLQSVRARRVLTLNDACERNARLLRINLNGVDADFPATLRGALSGFRGGQTALRLSYANATGNAEIELGPEWRVRATADLKRALDALPGVRQTALFEIKRKSGIDDDSDVDLHEDEEPSPIRLASAASNVSPVSM